MKQKYFGLSVLFFCQFAICLAWAIAKLVHGDWQSAFMFSVLAMLCFDAI